MKFVKLLLKNSVHIYVNLSDRSKKKIRSYKKRSRVEQFTNFYGIILRLFEETKSDKIHKSEIRNLILVRKKEIQTGLDNFDQSREFHPYSLEGVSSKEYFLKTTKILQQSELIEEVDEETEKDKRKDFFRLSRKGKKVSTFLIQLDEYQKNYFKLEKSIEDKIPQRSESELKRLRYHDPLWKKEELEFYFAYRSSILNLLDLIDNKFMQIIVFRYSKIVDYLRDDLYDDPILPSNKANAILNDLIIKVIENRTRYILEKSKVNEESAYSRWVEKYYNPIKQAPQFEEKYDSGFQGIMPFYKDIEDFFNYNIIPQVIYKEVTIMILSYLRMIEYPKDKISEDDIKAFTKDKDNIFFEYISVHKERDINYFKIKYDYESLVKQRLDTWELFNRILLKYLGNKS